MNKIDKTPLRILLQQASIVPAVRKPEHLDLALAAHSKVVFFLTGNPENCQTLIRRTLDAGKFPFINLDLLDGFARDKYAVNYFRQCGASGIISTHMDALRHVRSLGLYAVQRTFLVDSGAVEMISAQLKNTPMDALEVLPALAAPLMVDRVRAISPETVVMGGGLIRTMKEVEELLAQGLGAVSIGNPQMWIA
jgi:glycerol uptake operon antiterminator